MKGLTPRQKDCLDFITAFYADHEYGPSYKEIEAALGLHSKSAVSRLVTGLEERGYVSFLKYRARSIIPISEQDRVAALEAKIDRALRTVRDHEERFGEMLLYSRIKEILEA